MDTKKCCIDCTVRIPMVMLIDKDMIKKDLRLQTGFSTTTMSKLSKDENVSMDVIEKICTVLNCDVGDIMEFIPDKKEEQ